MEHPAEADGHTTVRGALRVPADRGANLFVASAACILAAAGFIELISALQEVLALGQRDALFVSLTTRQMMFVAAVLQLGVAWLLLRPVPLRASRKLGLVAWLSSVFLLYRVGLWSVGYTGACSCLGNASRWLSGKPEMVDLYAKVMLAYLLVGSLSLLAVRRLTVARARGTRPGRAA